MLLISLNIKFSVYWFLASCWSGPNAKNTYFEDGKAKERSCISNDYAKCDVTDSVCVGKKETNFVYTINDSDD